MYCKTFPKNYDTGTKQTFILVEFLDKLTHFILTHVFVNLSLTVAQTLHIFYGRNFVKVCVGPKNRLDSINHHLWTFPINRF